MRRAPDRGLGQPALVPHVLCIAGLARPACYRQRSAVWHPDRVGVRVSVLMAACAGAAMLTGADIAALKAYVQVPGGCCWGVSLRACGLCHKMWLHSAAAQAPGNHGQNQAVSTVRLHVTHSNLKAEFIELRLDLHVRPRSARWVMR